MTKSPTASENSAPQKTKVSKMETTELKNYSFPTIGEGGVVIQASSQEEATKAAEKLKADMAKRDTKKEDEKEQD